MKCFNNRRVLVVDDQEVIHLSFRTLFGSLHAGSATSRQAPEAYDGEYAMTGDEGLERVRAGIDSGQPHALAFVDMYMPQGWDGVETVSQFWAASPDLQIVLCTAFTDYSWSQIISRLGRTDQLLILKKPF